MASQTELQILIRTIADSQGITLTNEQLDKTVEKVGLLQEATEKQTTAEAEQKAEIQQRAQVALRQIEAEEKTAVAAKKTTDETEKLSKSMRDLRESGRGATEVLQGLERGGLGGLFEAARGSFNLIKGLSAGFTELGIAGAAALPILAAGASAIEILRMKADEMEKDNQRVLDAAGKRWLEYQRTVADATAAIDKDFKKQSEAVAKLDADFERLFKSIEKTEARNQKIAGLKDDLAKATLDTAEKQALGQPGLTDDQKKRISSDFGRQRDQQDFDATKRGLDNADLNAQVRLKNANEALNKYQEQHRDQDRIVSDAETEYNNAKGLAESFKAGDTSSVAEDARKKALAARDVFNNAVEKNSQIASKEGSAQEEIDAAKDTIAETSLRRQAYQQIIKGKLADDKAKSDSEAAAINQNQAAGDAKQVELQTQIEATKSADASSPTFGQHTDISKLVAAQAAANVETSKAVGAGIAVAQESQKTMQQHQKQLKQLSNDAKVSREQASGG